MIIPWDEDPSPWPLACEETRMGHSYWSWTVPSGASPARRRGSGPGSTDTWAWSGWRHGECLSLVSGQRWSRWLQCPHHQLMSAVVTTVLAAAVCTPADTASGLPHSANQRLSTLHLQVDMSICQRIFYPSEYLHASKCEKRSNFYIFPVMFSMNFVKSDTTF